MPDDDNRNNDDLSEADVAKRMERTLRRMIDTPPQPKRRAGKKEPKQTAKRTTRKARA